jgi:hypothetical protein
MLSPTLGAAVATPAPPHVLMDPPPPTDPIWIHSVELRSAKKHVLKSYFVHVVGIMDTDHILDNSSYSNALNQSEHSHALTVNCVHTLARIDVIFCMPWKKSKSSHSRAPSAQGGGGHFCRILLRDSGHGQRRGSINTGGRGCGHGWHWSRGIEAAATMDDQVGGAAMDGRGCRV